MSRVVRFFPVIARALAPVAIRIPKPSMIQKMRVKRERIAASACGFLAMTCVF